jgi:crotonobetainyl-CoA:carnitine CoA-transferase CaiB-like acyl-CoA transferase
MANAFNKDSSGPLHDIRIIDLSRLVAGNMLSCQLADFGADVIKIEREGVGDDLRSWREHDVDIFWKLYGRNKRSMTLDFKVEPGLSILKRLVEHSHVLIENFVPGTLEKFGLGPDKLHELNPALVIVRISGWGQTGPYSHKPGFGTLVEAMSGFAHLNGFADRPPALPPLALADMIAGLSGATGVLTALRVAEKTGQGQVVDLSLFEPIFSVIAAEAIKYKVCGEGSMRAGNQASQAAPRNVYPTLDGKYVALSGSMQSMALRIFETIGRPDMQHDPRFETNDARLQNRIELDRIIGEFILSRTRDENLALFEQANVTVGPVCDISDLVDHPYVRGREVLVDMEDAELGSVPMYNIVPRLSQNPGTFRRPAPKLGEHTQEIMQELEAGFSTH